MRGAWRGRRLAAVLLAVLFSTACGGPAPVAQRPAPPDPVTEPWYNETVTRIGARNAQARAALVDRDAKRAGAILAEAQPLAAKVLAAPRPTLAAMEAASDLDELYGRLLVQWREYGFARQTFQKNAARWKHWEPKTPDTERRLRAALDAIRECDRRIASQR